MRPRIYIYILKDIEMIIYLQFVWTLYSFKRKINHERNDARTYAEAEQSV